MIKVANTRLIKRQHIVPAGVELVVKDRDRVQEGTVLARHEDGREILAVTDGVA